MKKPFAILLLLAASVTLNAQTDNSPVFSIVAQMPSFKGNLSQYLSQHIIYPERERRAGITGTSYITFVVEKDGSVSGAKVLKGAPNGPGLDSTALAVVKAMPAWLPGVQNNKSVRVQFNLPVHFVLRDDPAARPKAQKPESADPYSVK
jgi:protein TonB